MPFDPQFFDDEPLALKPKAQKRPAVLTMLRYPRKQRKFLTDEELMRLPRGSRVVFDTELFKNYFLVAFKHIDTGSYFFMEESPDSSINKMKLRWLLYAFCIVGFNSIKYDIPIIEAFLGIPGVDSDLESLKRISDAIILQNETLEWTYKPKKYNHIDVIEVAPLQGSLKLYAARLHCQRMQEMPVNPHKPLTLEEAEDTREYCFNDLDNTELMLRELDGPIAMRASLGQEIGEDLRSRSDAQIAEAVIAKEFERMTGRRPRKSEGIDMSPRSYTPPSYMNFQTGLLQRTLAKIAGAEFEIGANGYAIIPPEIDGLKLHIGNQVYRMSIGALHSSETCVTLRSDDETAISDFDVASYYPKIILNGGIAPANMGPAFLEIYAKIVVRRVQAKKNKQSVLADGLKITTNGTFGKLGNPYSIMYAPELMLYITLTGQLTLLLLIEDAALHGFEVVSANTDGIVFRYPRGREAELQAIVKRWEANTSLELEQTEYVGYFARDVNNYMTLKKSGEWKTKGAYCERGSALNSVLSRNPETFICVDAVKAYIANKTPVARTIRECRDITRFVSIKNVRGGAHKNGVYLGKVVRWYYAQGEGGEINSVLSGNKVARTDGAKPLMELPTEFPADINYAWYTETAVAILKDIGYFGSSEQQRLF